MSELSQFAVFIMDSDSIHAPDATAEDLAECDDHAEKLVDADAMLLAYALNPRDFAVSVDSSGARPGTYLTGTPIVAGFYVIEAVDLDEAVRIASTNPVIESGGGVEVRPVHSGGVIRPPRS